MTLSVNEPLSCGSTVVDDKSTDVMALTGNKANMDVVGVGLHCELSVRLDPAPMGGS